MADTSPIRVVAIHPGFYGYYREPGDEFEVVLERHVSKTWMRVLSDDEHPASKEKDAPSDGLDDLDDDKLIAFSKANCPGLTLTRSMKDSTLRNRIREYQENRDKA